MEINAGHIVKNLIPNEPVVINHIQLLGTMVSIKYTGVNTNRSNTKVISKDVFEKLETLTEEGSFNFQGDPIKFSLFAEAERINSPLTFVITPLVVPLTSTLAPITGSPIWSFTIPFTEICCEYAITEVNNPNNRNKTIR